MNYHSDVEISKNVFRHMAIADANHPSNSYIFGVFNQGSANYGLDYEDSDTDTKCILLPNFESVVSSKDQISFTHVMDNDEHIDFKDIRIYMDLFKKQNHNFLEILFTEYYYVEEKSIPLWKRLKEKREEITHFDYVRSFKSFKGIASDKFHALEHPYPSKMNIINAWGYDPKQLHHLLRIYEFVTRFINGESYEECLHSKQAEYLIRVKQGLHELAFARRIAEETYQKIHDICNEQIEKHKNDVVDQSISDLLDDVAYTSIRDNCKRELMNEIVRTI